MSEFKVNVPVAQADPVVKVDASRDAPIPLGANRFRLVVVDDAGNESEPAFLNVIVRDSDKPTAVLQLVDQTGAVNEPIVAFGSSFILSAEKSSDAEPGKVVEYRFTLLDRG